ncbi:MAG: BON domain-containing protein [Ginsengibacter sp.]
MKTDIQIQKDVMDELKWSPLLSSAEIGVAVKDGVVTLSGIVDTYSKKMEAEKAIAKVSGVKGVAVDIQVGVSPYFKKTDAEIAQEVVKVLKLHTSIPDDKIKVKVEDGIVTLEGEVEWHYQRVAANQAIQNYAGIVNVWNFIKIQPKVICSNIKEKITAAFERSAKLDASRIFVETSGNTVTLKGTVASLSEKEDAAYAAWAAPGVSEVNNKLRVEEIEYAY